jgi:hypothetical protein
VLEASRDAVVIEFTVPRPPLVIDTSFLARQESAVEGGFSSLAGFRVHGVTLNAVEIASPTSVRLRFAKSLPAGEKCRVSYGYPFATALGSITAIQKAANGDEELVLTRSFAKELKPLSDEGAFFVTNTSGTNTRVPICATSRVNCATERRLPWARQSWCCGPSAMAICVIRTPRSPFTPLAMPPTALAPGSLIRFGIGVCCSRISTLKSHENSSSADPACHFRLWRND